MSQLGLFRSPLMALNDFLSRLKSYLFMFIHGKVSFWSIVVLGWAGKLAEYALWSRMTYLTDAWELDTTHAAAIVNGCKGVETIMPTGMAFLVDAFVSDYRMLLFSTLAYSLGMGFLAMSTLLSKYGGFLSCDNSRAKCITDAQKALFYMSLPFIIIGVSGHVASDYFLKKRNPIETESDQNNLESKKSGTVMSFFWKFIRFFVPVIITLALSSLTWFCEYVIPAIVLLLVALLFMSVSGSYKYATPQGSPLTTVFSVFVASASKMFCPLPRDAQELHENRPSSRRLPHTRGLRCLDKAAIVISIQNLEQQKQNRWKLCSVSEVEETKIFIRMIPIWLVFIMCGVVSSVGDTYFLDQADNLDRKIGKVKAPVFTLLIFQQIAEVMFATVTKKLVKKGSSKYAAPIGNIVATIFSILCCIMAAKMETKRLDMTQSYNGDNDYIPMSMFWLLPQFSLLGAVDGISHNLFSDDDEISGFNIACFFNGSVLAARHLVYNSNPQREMLHQTATADSLFASDLCFRPRLAPPIRPSALSFSMDHSTQEKRLIKQTSKHTNLLLACGAARDSHETSPRKDDAPVHGLSDMIVGVLGGGQLGRMLCQAASQMAIKVMVLDPFENCPASALSYHHMVGSFDDSATVQEFAKRCGVLTVEIEHVDVATLEILEKRGVDCQPKASTIRIIQDKYLQKVHFSQHAIPLPEFMQIDDLEGAKRAGDLFGYPLMIKSKRLAYDGRGNAVAGSEGELSSAVNALGGYGRGLYVEKWAPFVKELAVVVARGRDNSIVCYPVVETIHKENICHIVKAPANVTWEIRKRATDVAYRAVSSLEGAGIFAVELFLTGDGQILLNEVAPRPHNSGHHTIESCYTSQFEQHLRAVVGLPLGDPSMKVPAAIMYNILGEDEGEPGFFLAHQLIERALGIPRATVHWYDKPEIRKQRKMGHVTIVGPSMSDVEQRLKSMLKEEGSDCQSAVTPHVGIIMGSDSDLPVMKDAAKILNMFDVPYEVKIVSAHRTPEMMFTYASSAQERGIQIIIAGAGGAAHLPGMVAALTPLPVIGVPVRASALDGLDSLLSIVQMPRGVPVATVAINNATNAGLLAVRMLGIQDADLLARMSQYQEDTRNGVLTKAEKLEKDGWESYLNL